MNKKQDEKPTSIRLNPVLKKEIKAIADKEKRTFPAQLEYLLEIALKNYKK